MSCLSNCPNQLGDEFSNEGTASTLEEVLANGNTTGPHQIVVSAGESINASASGASILTRTLHTETISPLTFPIGTEIGILGNLTFPGDLILRNNANAGGTAVKINSVPIAPTTQANVLSYNPTTKDVYYQASASGGVASVSAGTNISVTGTATNPIVNLSAPLTSQLDAGNQIITSTTGDLQLSCNNNITMSADNIDLSTTRLIMPSIADPVGYVDMNQGKTTIIRKDAGAQANPLLILQNDNATGSVAMEVYKNKPTAGIAGDVLFNQSVYGKDNGNTKQEYTRITHTIRDSSIGGEDGSIEFSCFVNNAIQTFIQINGNENQVNCLRQLDMAGNSITSSVGRLDLVTTSGPGGDIRLQPQADQDIQLFTTGVSGGTLITASSGADATSVNTTYNSHAIQTTGSITHRTTGSSLLALQSQGTGGITIDANQTGGTGVLTAKGRTVTIATQDATAGSGTGLLLTGNTLLNATAGGNSGQHLCLTINGSVYKIALLNP